MSDAPVLDLLGVPVRLQGGDSATRERLSLWYAAFPRFEGPWTEAPEARSNRSRSTPTAGLASGRIEDRRPAQDSRTEETLVSNGPSASGNGRGDEPLVLNALLRRQGASEGSDAMPTKEKPAQGAAEDDSAAADKRVCWNVAVDGRPATQVVGFLEAIRAFNHELLHAVMLRRRSGFYIHGAVIAFGDKGVVLPGLSRSGKSTLALAAIQRGGRFLSDDLAVFEPGTGQCLAYPRALKIRDECVPYFPSFADQFLGDGEGRLLPFDALPEATVMSQVAVKMVVLPKWSAEESPEFVPISSGKALLRVAESALNFGAHREQSIDHLSGLLKGTRSYRMTWREPHHAVQRIMDALAES